jgi:hypothetical protein
MIGTSIEHYEIIERLGQGGMGAVYRATDTLLEREVALKVLRPEYAADPQFAERFRAEAVTLAKLSHTNIATLFGFVKDSSQLCMIMELATGETLGHLLKRTGALSWERAVLLTGQMLDALQYAHERGVVHRDIKPSNLMVGEDDHLKLMDFGIARLMGTTRVTQMGFTVGTLEYMAPEQIRGEDVDGRADIYATGVVLYEMVTGQLPFGSSREQALMFAHLQQEVVPPRTHRPNLPWWLSDVIVRALAKSPGDRFASAREFSDALGASPQAQTANVRTPSGQTVTGTAAAPRRRTAASRAVASAGVANIGRGDDDSTRMATPVGGERRGFFARWRPRVQVSSNKFGGAQEPGVMYQAAVGAGGFGGAIRIVAVRMGTASRKAASRVTQVIGGAGYQIARRPLLVMLLVIAAVGGGWYWRQRQVQASSADLGVPQEASALSGASTPVVPASGAAPGASSGTSSDPAATPAAPGTLPAPAPAPAADGSDPSAVPAPAPPLETAAPATPAAPAGSAGSEVAAPAGSPASGAAVPAGSPASGATAPVRAPGVAPTPAVGAPPSNVAVPPRSAAGRPASGATAPASTTRGGTRAPAATPSGRSPAPPAESTRTALAATPAAAAEPVVDRSPVVPDYKLENEVTLLTPKDGDVEETEGVMTLRRNEIVIIDDDEKVVRTVRLRADGAGKGPAVSGPAHILSHRRDRWLVLPLGGEQFVVQVDRDDVPKLMAALEARLGRPVTMVDGEPKFPKH